jgi:WD40 repeat protein
MSGNGAESLPPGGHLAIDVAPPIQTSEAAPGPLLLPPLRPGQTGAEVPPFPAVPSFGYPGLQRAPPLGLSIHRLDGWLQTSAVSPIVRIHIIDAATGLWRTKESNAPSIFNLDNVGEPYLRTASEDDLLQKDLRGSSFPWVADTAPSSVLRPFATTPSTALRRGRSGIDQIQPRWEESFLVAESLPSGSAFLFEVLDVQRVQTKKGFSDISDDQWQLLPLGWGFLNLDTALGIGLGQRPRRLRLQLYRYCHGRPWDLPFRCWTNEDDGSEEVPAVVREYLAAGFGQRLEEEQPGLLRRLFASLTGRGPVTKERLSAALEITLTLPQTPADFEKAADATRSVLVDGSRISDSAETPRRLSLHSASPKQSAEADVADDSTGKLQPHHHRLDGEPTVVPTTLLSQIAVGKRGASRLSISPSGKLLAAAVSKAGTSFELRVFCLTTGRLHAKCEAGHDALVYDLCWHAFTVKTGGVESPPLLISCAGDGVVLIYEVPEELHPLPGQTAPVLRLHARINFPSHVYSVRPHPALTSDPRRVVLLVGGHSFGLMVCEISRIWKQAHPEAPGCWVANQNTWQEKINYEVYPVRPKGNLASIFTRRDSFSQKAGATERSDVLCVRFSTQATQPDSLYVTDAAGRVMLFQIRIDVAVEAGRGAAIRGSFVRSYVSSELAGTAIYGLEVVTQQLVKGKRISSVQLSMVDDWVLLFSRDHVIRLASLQRGVLKIELEMSGLECFSYPVHGCMSPDAAYVACGSESGQLLVWNGVDGKELPARTKVPEVQLSGPVMDVVWSDNYHLLACCAIDNQAPPLLVFVGGEAEKVNVSLQANALAVPTTPPPRKNLELPHRPVPLKESLRDKLAMTPTSLDLTPTNAEHKWASSWLNSDQNARSVLTLDEKRKMKENILLKLLEQKAAENVENYFAPRTRRPDAIPGGA